MLPVLLLLILGGIDLGRAFHTKVVLANASSAAANYATNYKLGDQLGTIAASAAVVAKARNEAAPHITLTEATFDGTWTAGDRYTIRVATNWSPVTPLIAQLWGGGPLRMGHFTALRHNCAANSNCTYPTITPSPTATYTPTPPPTVTPTPTLTPTPTVTPTPTNPPTSTSTRTPTVTSTPTPCPPLTVVAWPTVTTTGNGSNHTVVITWTASGAGLGMVDYGARNGPSGVYVSSVSAGTDASHTATITGLNNGTYHYRLRMQNACGAWSTTSDATFTVS